MHAQRGKVVVSVVVVVTVVIKITTSQVLGDSASANCRSSVENSDKMQIGTSKLLERPVKARKWCFLYDMPILIKEWPDYIVSFAIN